MKRYSLDALEMFMANKPTEPAEFTRGGQVVMRFDPIEGLQEIPAQTFTQPLAATLIERITDTSISHRHARGIAATVGRLVQWDNMDVLLRCWKMRRKTPMLLLICMMTKAI